MGKVTREVLIEDIQALNKLCPGKMTRNFYRANGAYSEAIWQVEFPAFVDFCKAAGINQEEIAPEETNEYTEDSWNISLRKTRISSLEQLVEHCKIDLGTWEVERFICNKWEVGAKNESGDIIVEPLFQVKAFLRKKAQIVAIQKEIAELKVLAKSFAHKATPIVRSKVTSGNMLEIDIPDAHFGKLAQGYETGYQNVDTKITTKIFLRAFDTLMSRVVGHKFDEIVFIIGNDLLNSDNAENTTTKGTQVTTDGRYHKTFTTVRTVMAECIRRLREIAPVKVIMVPGNHDTLSNWHLGDSLDCLFINDPEVTIDNTPRYRKYHQFGNVMLMFTHGDKGKKNDYPLLMATEQPVMFGNTKYREAHTGHTHQTKLDEQHGVRVRVLPALCPPDDWHAENGFTGNLRNAEAYIWNKDEGLVGMAFYCDDAKEPFE